MWFHPLSFTLLPSLSRSLALSLTSQTRTPTMCPPHNHVAIMWKSVGILNINCTFILGKQNMRWINHGIQGCLDSYPLFVSAFMCCEDASQEINSGQWDSTLYTVCILYILCVCVCEGVMSALSVNATSYHSFIPQTFLWQETHSLKGAFHHFFNVTVN